MPKQNSLKRDLLLAVLSALIAIVSAIDMVGQPTRLVHILSIAVGSM